MPGNENKRCPVNGPLVWWSNPRVQPGDALSSLWRLEHEYQGWGDATKSGSLCFFFGGGIEKIWKTATFFLVLLGILCYLQVWNMELSQPAKDFILALIQPDPVLSSKPGCLGGCCDFFLEKTHSFPLWRIQWSFFQKRNTRNLCLETNFPKMGWNTNFPNCWNTNLLWLLQKKQTLIFCSKKPPLLWTRKNPRLKDFHPPVAWSIPFWSRVLQNFLSVADSGRICSSDFAMEDDFFHGKVLK